jgi:dephospho-CoA kinase
VVYDVPLLFEAGIDTRVDKTLVVTADRETQLARLKKRNGLSRVEAIRRIRSQMPLSKKVRLADIVIDGTLSRHNAMKAVRGIFLDLLRPT